MQDLRSAWQFIILTIIARLIVYLIVRLIESVRPRNAHFIISSVELVKLPERQAEQTESRKRCAACTMRHCRGALRRWFRGLRLRWMYYLAWFASCCYNCRPRLRTKIPLKLLSEIIGLISAIVSLLIILLNYFLK